MSGKGSGGSSAASPIEPEIIDPAKCKEYQDYINGTGEYFISLAFIGLVLCTVVFLLMASRAEREKQKFFYTITFISGISAMFYVAMLTAEGITIIRGCREEFYVRYIDWFFTMPLIVLVLCMIANIDMFDTYCCMGSTAIMVFSFLSSTLAVPLAVKWSWLAIAAISFVPIAYSVLSPFRRRAELIHPATASLYQRVSLLIVVCWILLFLVWMVGEGLNVISVNISVILYGLIDMVTKGIFGFYVLMSHEALLKSYEGYASIDQIGQSGTKYGTIESQFM